MEILKFSEPPKRKGRSSSRKTTGMSSLIAVAIGVLVLGGMSTTLAGTISLNGGSSVEFGQGVVTTAACDSSITVTPTSSYDTSTAFSVTSVTLSNIGSECFGKVLTVKAYSDSVQLKLNNPTATYYGIKVKIPAVLADAQGNSWDKPKYLSSGGTWSEWTAASATSNGAGKWTTDAATNSSSSGAITLTASDFKISSDLTKITVESADGSTW